MCETQNILIAVGGRSKPRPSRVFANSMLISVFSYCIFLSCFLVVSSQVFAKRSFASLLIFFTLFSIEYAKVLGFYHTKNKKRLNLKIRKYFSVVFYYGWTFLYYLHSKRLSMFCFIYIFFRSLIRRYLCLCRRLPRTLG